MKPVDQTLLTQRGEPGDCWRACIASVLELPIEDVPHFTLEAARMAGADVSYPPFDYEALKPKAREIARLEWELTNAFLAKHGKRLRMVGAWAELVGRADHAIASGPSNTVPGISHAVIVDLSATQFRNDGRAEFVIVHDPNPSRKGISIVECVDVIDDLVA